MIRVDLEEGNVMVKLVREVRNVLQEIVSKDYVLNVLQLILLWVYVIAMHAQVIQNVPLKLVLVVVVRLVKF